MKRNLFAFCAVAFGFYACNKSASGDSSVSLTSSTLTTSIGQTVTVTASTSANSLSWSVTPAGNARAAYTVTTEKTNYISFSKAGTYTVGVRARSLSLDSVHHCNYADSSGHHFQDSVWNHHIDSLWITHGFHEGGCKNGKDSASVRITVQ